MSVPETGSENCFVDTNIWLYAFSFCDSTIVASALYADASVLYSEDIQDGLVVENRVRILNPFKELPQTGTQSGGNGA